MNSLAIPELSEGMVLGYLAALAGSGILLLLLAALGGFFRQSAGARIFNAVVGLAFLGYAGYLLLFAGEGDTIIIFYYAFAAPILLLINAFRSRVSTSAA